MLGKSDEQTGLLVASTIADGGEGLILRLCGSLYERGRSLSLIKLKVYHSNWHCINY